MDLQPQAAEVDIFAAFDHTGVACFGYVVGTVSSLTSKSARREVQIRQKMDFVSEYMRGHRLPRALQVCFLPLPSRALHTPLGASPPPSL